MSPTLTFFSPCPRGLEPLLADEIREQGGQTVQPISGGVQWQGSLRACYQVNLSSRLASRVLLRIATSPYRDEASLYQAAHAIDWPQWFSVERTLRVDVTAVRSPLNSVDFALLRIKDAICDRFRDACGERPSVDTRAPQVRISAFLDEREAVFYIDTSGEPLFKRGYRRARREAPLKENLAAGLIRLTGWDPAVDGFIDPMCGSGTIAIEAALIATATAPGKQRQFAFENLSLHDAPLWAEVRTDTIALERPARQQPILASDRDPAAIEDVRAGLRYWGLEDRVQVEVRDVTAAAAPGASGVWLTNPPYGVRMGSEPELIELYRAIGTTLKRRFAGWRCHFITEDRTLPRGLGLRESRRTPIFNGRLDCRLFEFRMVEGSARKRAD